MGTPKTPSPRQGDEEQATDDSSSQSVESLDGSMVVPSRWEDAFGPPLTTSSASGNIMPLNFVPFQVPRPVTSGPLLSGPSYDAGLAGSCLWGHQTNTQLQGQTDHPQGETLAVQYLEELPLTSYTTPRPLRCHQTHRRPAKVVLKYKVARLVSKYRAAIKKERALREQFDAAVLDAELAVRQIIDRISSLHADWQTSKNHREEMKMRTQQGCEEALRAMEQQNRDCCPRPATTCDASTSRTGGSPNPMLGTDFTIFCGNTASRNKNNESMEVELSQDVQAGRDTGVSNTGSSESASFSDQTAAVLQQMPEDGSWIGVPGLVAPPYRSEFADLVVTSTSMTTDDEGCLQIQHKRSQVWAGDSTLSASRRGVVIEVPFATTLSQASKIFRLPASVATVSLFDVPGSKEPLKNVAVEFTTQAAATSFIQDTTAQGYQLQDQHGNLYTIRAYLIPTLTARASPCELRWLWKGVTRRVVFAGFPQKGVWRFITRLNVPLHRILHLDYDCRSSELTVEFASILEAGRAVFPADEADMDEFSFLSKMRYGSSFRFVGDDEPAAGSAAYGTGPIPYIPLNDLVVRFDQLPWNQQAQPFLPYNPRRFEIRAMADKFQIEEEEVFPFLDRLEVEEDGVVYDIVGSDIKLTRYGVDYSLPAEDKAKLFMANTLHDPRCRDIWDRHFAALGVPNRRKYEEYGMIAQQRREEAGTDEEKEYLKDAEIPEVIRQYCQRGYQRKVSYIGSGCIADGS